jgi:phosphoribosyl 1,2-cyclic phosphodiesterase
LTVPPIACATDPSRISISQVRGAPFYSRDVSYLTCKGKALVKRYGRVRFYLVGALGFGQIAGTATCGSANPFAASRHFFAEERRFRRQYRVVDLSVHFWGVRGSIPCPGHRTARYGGNTACVEVRCGDRLLIFDAGTGLRGLGNSLVQTAGSVRADIFLSHCHIDHIAGLPFFAPCYLPASQLRVWAGNLLPERALAQVARMVMSDPLFPSAPAMFKANIKFRDFHSGEVLKPHPDIVLRTVPLNHPGGATGYRLEYGHRSIAYITDTEHQPGRLDAHVLALAEGVDLMIYDCNYTDEQFAARAGWGHSTWQEGVRIAKAARAETLAIFHHDPDHDDDFLDRVGAEARALHPGTVVAAEGMALRIAPSESRR